MLWISWSTELYCSLEVLDLSTFTWMGWRGKRYCCVDTGRLLYWFSISNLLYAQTAVLLLPPVLYIVHVHITWCCWPVFLAAWYWSKCLKITSFMACTLLDREDKNLYPAKRYKRRRKKEIYNSFPVLSASPCSEIIMCAQFLIYTKIPLVEFPWGSGFLCPLSWYSPKDITEELGWSKSGLNAAGSPLYSSLEAKRREAKLPPLKWGFLITENNPLAGSKEKNLFPQPKRGRTQ